MSAGARRLRKCPYCGFTPDEKTTRRMGLTPEQRVQTCIAYHQQFNAGEQRREELQDAQSFGPASFRSDC